MGANLGNAIRLVVVSVLVLSIAGCATAPGYNASPGTPGRAAPGPAPAGGLVVTDFGAAGDGTHDDAEAFQRALDAAGAAGGGVVHVPTGRYVFKSPLTVPKDVTLRGVFTSPTSHSTSQEQQRPEFGTVFLVRCGAGKETDPPFITLQTNSVLQGVSIVYPDQGLDPPPTPYPWTVQLRGNNPAMLDVELLNPYQGVLVGPGGRQLVRNVNGQPLFIGLKVDQAYDCCRLENVHWNPWWTYESPMARWQLDHGTGFLFGRTDGQYALNTFCFNYHSGYKFIRSEQGVAYGQFTGANAELCHACIEVEECATWGIHFNGGGYALLDPPRSMMVRVGPKNRGTVRFNNCGFWGPTDQCAEIEGRNIGMVCFSNCTFAEWPEDRSIPAADRGKRTPCVRALGGSVMIRGCEFRDYKPQVYLGPKLRGAIVSENIMHWPIDIRSEMVETAVIRDNLGLRRPEDELSLPK